MKNALQNVLADLREKRLLPVAILLLAGLVAVPVLLAKPAEEQNASGPATPSAANQDQATRALVALADEGSGSGSMLKLFNPRDPFAAEGVKNLHSLGSTELGSASTQLASSSAKSGGASDPGSTGTSGGGSTGGTTTGGGTGGGTTGGGTTGGGTTEVTAYTYVLDLTFTKDGHKHAYSSVSKLAQLPNEDEPLLLFLGVDSGGDNAVFLVDSTLTSDGEGHCEPSPSDCATLSIGAGSVQHFSDADGHSYTLQIDEIRKVKLDKASASSEPRARAAEADSAAGSVGARSVRRFAPPLLADLVTVASESASDSRSDEDSR
jgi:hypothetical protein